MSDKESLFPAQPATDLTLPIAVLLGIAAFVGIAAFLGDRRLGITAFLGIGAVLIAAAVIAALPIPIIRFRRHSFFSHIIVSLLSAIVTGVSAADLLSVLGRRLACGARRLTCVRCSWADLRAVLVG